MVAPQMETRLCVLNETDSLNERGSFMEAGGRRFDILRCDPCVCGALGAAVGQDGAPQPFNGGDNVVLAQLCELAH